MKNTKQIDTSKLTDIELDDVNMSDSPDFCDAYIASAKIDGRDLTDAELDSVNEDRDYVLTQVENFLY